MSTHGEAEDFSKQQQVAGRASAERGAERARARARAQRATVIALIASLAACAVGPNFKRPPAPAATGYGSASPAQSPAVGPVGPAGEAQRFVTGMDIPAEWWTLFRSPKLNLLVEQALKGNPDVGAAQAALRQAHELYRAQWTSFFPSVQGDLSGTRNKNAVGTIANPTSLPQANPYYNLYTAQLTVSYLPDVFGATRRQVEIAKAQVESSRFELEATYLTLSSNVVATAVQEGSLRGQIAATERLLELQHQLTDKVQRQRAVGTVNDLDVLAQQALEAQTAQTLPPLQKQLGQTRDALTALLGRLPADEPQETFRLQELRLPMDLPISLPSKLIEQRPDVRQAEETLHAAAAAVGVAIANLLPQFALNANVGSSALALRQLFSPYTGFWDVGASLTETLFDAGALLHKKRAADAVLDQAGAQYRAAVILACQNVADALRALKSDADALAASAAAERTAKAAFDLVQRQRTLGTISVIAVLNAEQAYREAELSRVQAEANRYADTAGLFQSLGGGWWNRTGESRYEQFSPPGE
jgi:NodT family efflux transporter outer membrane factor (OMF) lipoprotein